MCWCVFGRNCVRGLTKIRVRKVGWCAVVAGKVIFVTWKEGRVLFG